MEPKHSLPLRSVLMFSALFLGVITAGSEATSHSQSVIHVTHSTGNGSLYYHLCHKDASINSGTEVLLDPGVQHILPNETFCLLSNIFDLIITSSSPSTTAQVMCQPRNGEDPVPMTGFGFLNMTNLRISNVNFTNCGGLLTAEASSSINDSSLYLTGTEAAVLFFSHCHNVSLERINMLGTYGYGVLLANVFDESSMRDVEISDSGSEAAAAATAFDVMSSIGSGILVYYFNSSFSAPKRDTELSLRNITLKMNTNIIKGLSVCIDSLYPPESHSLPQQPLLTAAGITLIYRQNTFPVQVKILQSVFDSNIGMIGGGMMLLHLDTMNSSRTIIDNSTTFKQNRFVNNTCHGAAINAYTFFSHGFIQRLSPIPRWTPLTIANSLIMDHKGNDSRTALGAVYLGSVFQDIANIIFQIHSTDFKDNLGIKTGICLYAETLLGMSMGGTTMTVELRDVKASDNAEISTTPNQSAAGLFAFSNVGKALVHGSTANYSVFQNNNGAVFYAFRSNLYLSGHLIFSSNHARNGAAFRLHGGSHIFLTQALRVVFAGNVAGEYGGSIFAQSNSDENKYCTFQVASSTTTNFPVLNISLNFQRNHAGWSGGSVFASALYDCRMYNAFSPVEVYNQTFKFQNDDKKMQDQLVSNPVIIKSAGPNLPVIIHPGQDINLSLSAWDQGGSPVFTAVFLTLEGYSSSFISHPMHDAKLWLKPSQRVQILNSTKSKNTTEWPVTTATVHAASSCFNESDQTKRCHHGKLYVSIPSANPSPSYVLEFHLQPCPLGFELSPQKGVCDCADIIQQLQVSTKMRFECDINKQIIIQKERITRCHWLGIFKQQFAIAYSCPPMFCNCTSNIYNTSDSNYTSCINQRTGPLCGSCPENLSVVFGSDICQPCSNIFLTSILLYAFLGLFLVLILFTLKTTLTVGTINGIIFYANLANTGLFDLLDLQPFSYLSAATLYIRVFLSLLNLNLGFPLCFYDGMTEIEKAFFQFAFPIYLLSLIGVLVLVSRWSSRVSAFTSKGVIPVLVTLLHLSFSRLLLTVVDSFALTYITTTANQSYVVWFRDGSVGYKDPTYITLMSLSAACMILFLLPYFILLLGARVWIRSSLVSKHLKPLFDAILAPYREGKKHWFGARLIFLAIAYIVYALFRGGRIFLIINGTIITSFNIFHACARPFKYYLLNLLDSWIMVNISVLYISTTYFIFSGLPESAHLIAFILANLTFITFLGVLLCHVLHVTGVTKKLRRLVRHFRRRRPRASTQPLNLSHVIHYQATMRRNRAVQESFEEENAELREPVLGFVSSLESRDSI